MSRIPIYAVLAGLVSGTACDRHCASLNGPLSWCKAYQKPPVCSGRNQPCDLSICGSVSTTSSPTNSTSQSTTTTARTTTTTLAPSSCTATQQNTFCQRLNGPLSHCKVSGSGFVCHGGNQVCSCLTVLAVPTTTTAVPSTSDSHNNGYSCDRSPRLVINLDYYCCPYAHNNKYDC
jgi:hypothetical protein